MDVMRSKRDDQIGTSALLSFTAQNVRSYRDDVHLSLVASRLARPEVVQQIRHDSGERTVDVLPAAVVFGANASGKSTLLRAMNDMRDLVLGSFRHGSATSMIPRVPFKLDSNSLQQPTQFEIDLVLRGIRWQYGLEIDDNRVISEYAFHYPNGRQAVVFRRDGDRIKFGKVFQSDGRLLERLLRPNALLISVAGAARSSELGPLFEWFQTNLLLAESSNREWRALRTAELAQSSESRDQVLTLLSAADLGITDISREKIPEELRSQLEQMILGENKDLDDEQVQLFIADRLRLTHGQQDNSVDFDAEDESLGTIVWVGLIGPIVDALNRGDVLLADELDASLHPHLVEQIIAMFQDPATNPHCAQLVFNAHDATLLGDSDQYQLGRDQIWFTEKSTTGKTRLYPLIDFNPRKDEALERRYLQGRFGGLPILNASEFGRSDTFVDS